MDAVCLNEDRAAPPAGRAPLPALEPWRKIDCRAFGELGIGIGDLDGDGLPEIVVAQAEDHPARKASAGGYPHEKTVTCLTAVNLAGEILWQRGTPRAADRRKYHGDGPVLVHDLDADGRAEIVLGTVRENLPLVQLFRGDGELVAERETGANYSLISADLRGLGSKRDVILGTGLSLVFAYNEKLEPIWEWCFHYGGGHEHAAADVEGRGRDDLFIGVSRLDASGKRIWWRPDLDDAMEGMERCPHIDHIYVRRLRPGDPTWHVLWLGGHDALCLDARDGCLLWRVAGEHLQEAAIGRFDPSSPHEMLFIVEKGPSQMDRLIDSEGREVWRRNVGRCAALPLAGPDGSDLIVCWLPADGSRPYVMDFRGERLLEFDFPYDPPSRIALRQERPLDRGYGAHVRIHDMDGDGRPEVVLFNRETIAIYKVHLPSS